MKTIILTGSTVDTEVPFDTAEAGWHFTLQGLGGNTFDQERVSDEAAASFADVPPGQYVARMWREAVGGAQLGEIAEATFEFTEEPETKMIATAATITVQIV